MVYFRVVRGGGKALGRRWLFHVGACCTALQPVALRSHALCCAVRRRHLGATECKARLEKHWSTFFTLADVQARP